VRAPSTKDDPIEFTFSPAKGEPYRLALVSGDNNATIVIVPDPITATDKGCTLNVVQLLPGFETAYFTGSGFAPDTEITFEGRSFDESHPIKTRTGHDGSLSFALMPFVAGKKKGKTTVRGLGTECSPNQLRMGFGAVVDHGSQLVKIAIALKTPSLRLAGSMVNERIA